MRRAASCAASRVLLAAAAAAGPAQPARCFARRAVPASREAERAALREALQRLSRARALPIAGGRVLGGGGGAPAAAVAAARARDGAAALAEQLEAQGQGTDGGAAGAAAPVAAEGEGEGERDAGPDASVEAMLARGDAAMEGAGERLAARWARFARWARALDADAPAAGAVALVADAAAAPVPTAALREVAEALDGHAAVARGLADVAQVGGSPEALDLDALLPGHKDGDAGDQIGDEALESDELDVLAARLAAGGLSEEEERSLTARWHAKAQEVGRLLEVGMRVGEEIDAPLSDEVDRVLQDEVDIAPTPPADQELGELFDKRENRLALEAMMAPTALPDFRVFAKLVDSAGRIRPRYHTKLSKRQQTTAARRIKMMRNLGLVPIESAWERIGEDRSRIMRDYVPVDDGSDEAIFRDLINSDDKTAFDWFGAAGSSEKKGGDSKESFREQMQRLALERQRKQRSRKSS